MKDPEAQFKGKKTLTENEIRLIKRRMNEGKLSRGFVGQNGPYNITASQSKKGLNFLMRLWKTPRGVEKKNNPFGFREQEVLKNFKKFTLIDMYDTSTFGGPASYTPLFKVHSKDGGTFEYYVGGQFGISIVG